MKSLFDPSVNKEIMDRIEKLSPETQRLWGKMAVSQMMTHCQKPLQVAYGELALKRGLIGILFGGMAKKSLMKDQPFGKSLPTHPKFVVKDDRNFDEEKEKLRALITRFSADNISKEPHPFFGKMTIEEWDILQWKHLDHHLRQFGA